MNIPLYLRIILPLTIAACGYAMWADSTPDEAIPVSMKSVKAKRPLVVEKMHILPQLTLMTSRNLFPYQGPPIIEPDEVSKNSGETGSTAALAPEPVRAPPFPFRVSGVWNDGGHRKIILTKGDKDDQTVILCQGCDKSESPRVGDVIDGNYRLKKIENERITFTYLPLKIDQIVNLDEAFTGTGN